GPGTRSSPFGRAAGRCAEGAGPCGSVERRLVGCSPERRAAVDVFDQPLETLDQSSHARRADVGGNLEGDDPVCGLEAIEKEVGRVQLRDVKGPAPPLLDGTGE